MSERKYFNEVLDPPAKCKIVNQNGDEQKVLLVALEDDVVSRVNAGRQLTVCFNVEAVGSDEDVYVLLRAGAKEQHLRIDVKAVGEWAFQSSANSLLADDGTEQSPFNRKSNIPVDVESSFFLNPLVLDEGDSRLVFYFGSGDRANNVTSTEQVDQLESILSPNSDLLIKLTNRSSIDSYLSVVVDFHEQEVIE